MDLTSLPHKVGKGKRTPYEVAGVMLGDGWRAMSEAEVERSLDVVARFSHYSEALTYAQDLSRRPAYWAAAIHALNLGYSKQAARERAAIELRQDYRNACEPPTQYVISVRVYLSPQDPDDLFTHANHLAAIQGPCLGERPVAGG